MSILNKGLHEEFYGQNGEDCLLWEFFGKRETGFYLDVGAFDGIYLSNTYWFEQQNWNGICVEPLPEYFEMCVQNRPNAICVNAACVESDNIKGVPLFTEPMGILSTTKKENEDDVRLRYQNRNLDFDGLKQITVPARTIDSILNEWKPPNIPIDIVSIDVEGSELEVLKGFNLKKFCPRILVIEANTPAALKDLTTFLEQFGYKLGKYYSSNAWFVNNTDDLEYLQSLSLDCYLAKSLHPSGQEFTPSYQQSPRKIHISAEKRSYSWQKRIINFAKYTARKLFTW